MSSGMGKIELAILAELKHGDALDINDLAIAAAGLKEHVLYFPGNTPEYQSAARAVRSLVTRGLVVLHGGGSGGKKLYKIR